MYRLKIKIKNFVNRNSFMKKPYELASEVIMKVSQKVSDEKYAKLLYKFSTGKDLNLVSPTTFDEKIWWLKLNNRNPLLILCTDKVKVRKYVKECGLEHILSEVDSIYDDANDINFAKLPDKAFIKTNHSSGTIKFWDKSDPFDKMKFIKEFNKSLKENYYWKSREWNYKNIEPKIIVENVIVDNENESLRDYRLLCFDGVVEIIYVDIETAAEDGTHNPDAKRNVYDKDFNYLDIKVAREQFDKSRINKPKNFEYMIEYAEILSKPFPFCRVDFYNTNGKIIFGEMTFYPQGGISNITPEKYNQIIGDWIDLESDKVILSEKIK